MTKIKVKLKLHHSLKDLSIEEQIVKTIVDGISSQFDVSKLKALKNSMQLVTDIMNCVENVKLSKSIKKKDIVVKVFHELFDGDEDQSLDYDKLDDDIEFACKNKLLAKYTMLRKALGLITKVFLTK